MLQYPGSRALAPSMGSLLLLLVVLLGACRSSPDAAPPLTDRPELDAFARQVEADLERHAWRDVIAAASPAHYRTQVADHGMSEAQYLAELFGLHRVDNNIKRGERVGWSDLERIADVELERVVPAGADHQLVGTVTLRDGTRLELRARVVREEGEYVLTGGVG